jgi:hypothetical protein
VPSVTTELELAICGRRGRVPSARHVGRDLPMRPIEECHSVAVRQHVFRLGSLVKRAPLLTALALAACGGPAPNDPPPSINPLLRDSAMPDGGDGGCHPVACQAWTDYAERGGGGPGALLCAAACMSSCDGVAELVRLDVAEAAEAGVTCIW